jgi:hypothetical protein
MSGGSSPSSMSMPHEGLRIRATLGAGADDSDELLLRVIGVARRLDPLTVHAQRGAPLAQLLDGERRQVVRASHRASRERVRLSRRARSIATIDGAAIAAIDGVDM